MRDPFQAHVDGLAIMRLDAAATERARSMLATRSWREVYAWLEALDRQVAHLDTEGVIAMAEDLEDRML